MILSEEVELLETLATQAWQPEAYPGSIANPPRSTQSPATAGDAPVFARHLPHAPNFDQIEKITSLIYAPGRSRTDPFPGKFWAEVEHPWIWLRTAKLRQTS
jgi:tRNA(Ile)-lysidine synthase